MTHIVIYTYKWDTCLIYKSTVDDNDLLDTERVCVWSLGTKCLTL